jgi:hypothetical protein
MFSTTLSSAFSSKYESTYDFSSKDSLNRIVALEVLRGYNLARSTLPQPASLEPAAC